MASVAAIRDEDEDDVCRGAIGVRADGAGCTEMESG